MKEATGKVIAEVVGISSIRNEELIRLSPSVEVAIVGGIGVLLFAAPNIVQFVGRKAQVIRTRLVLLKDSMCQAETVKKLEALNRKRKVGSIIRVIGCLLPDRLFTPPLRIYIPKWALASNRNQYNFHHTINDLVPDNNLDVPSENDVGDGLIEAFEINSEVISSLSGADDDDIDEDDETSSTPEGWTREQRLMAKFNPTMNATSSSSFTRCSTPKANKREAQLGKSCTLSNDSKIIEEQSLQIKEQGLQIEKLTKAIESLILHSQSNMKNQGPNNVEEQSTLQLPVAPQAPVPASSTFSNALPSPQTLLTDSPPTQIAPAPVLPAAPVLPNNNSVTIPGAPPPPPPPMPSMPLVGMNKLVITRKGGQDKLEKKPLSMTDVLKELPNARLKPVVRSPGGTPIKPPRTNQPSDMHTHLTDALKRRFASMHSPATDSELDLDKENMNGSGDSFDDDDSPAPVPAKRKLFPKVAGSPQRRSFGRQESRVPFGQHLLKKRNNHGNGNELSPLASSPLREQNS